MQPKLKLFLFSWDLQYSGLCNLTSKIIHIVDCGFRYMMGHIVSWISGAFCYYLLKLRLKSFTGVLFLLGFNPFYFFTLIKGLS